MSRALVIQPPLPLSGSFIDYPWFGAWGAYGAAAGLEAVGWQVTVLDGLTAVGADLHDSESGLWLGEPAADYLARLAGAELELAIIHASPFLLAVHARPWLEQLVAAVAGKPLVVAEMFSGGMHYIETDGEALLAGLPDVSLLLRYECEPHLARLGPGEELPSGEVWENREPFALDQLPAPAWQHMDIDGYYALLERVLSSPLRPGLFPSAPRRTLPLITSRGCPFGCVFCSKNPGLPGDRRQVRAVPLSSVEEWVARWVVDYGVERLVVLDELVNFDAERFDGLLSILEGQDLRVEFPNGLRADLLTDAQIRRLAPRTSTIKVSLESAVVRVQRELLGKNLDPAEVERVAATCHDVGVPFEVHCMIGIPGESRADILATLEMAARLHEQHGATPRLQFAAPLRGTLLAQRADEHGWIVDEPADPYTGFQQRGVLATDTFDPDVLERARRSFERRIRDAPRKVIVNLTYRCNNHCVFCAVGDRPPEDADPTAVVEALRRYRDQGYELLDIDGGEPSLHSELLTVIEAAKRLGYERVSVITNGRRASYPAFARQLVRAGVDEILISLHGGEPAVQDNLTGVPGSFEQTVAGIENCLAVLSSPEHLAVNTTVVVENLEHLGGLADLLVRLGVRRWNVQLVTPFGRAEASQVPSEDDLRRHLGALIDQPPVGVRMQVINCPPCLLPGHEELAAVDFGKAARDMVFVGAAGENLQGYLAQRRQRTSRCDNCLDALVCPGEYVFSPE